MCGLVGTYGHSDEAALGRALARIAPRGPDGEGRLVRADAALGHRRLAIVDLSSAGLQPMWNDDRTVAIVFNGEIYDHRALRAELGGGPYAGDSDTEVLLRAYCTLGIDRTLARIRGMYAFAILDTRRGELHLARDPFGKKPLFYARTPRGVAFASTVPALLELLGTTPPARPAAIADALTLLYVPGPETYHEGVLQLPPGTRARADLNGGFELVRHFTPTLGPFAPIDEDELVEAVDERLTAAVRRRLVADVPLGAFLSSGLDSALVVAAMSAAGGRVKTLTMGFRDAAKDEREGARIIAQHFGTDHVELELPPLSLRGLPALAACLGQPLCDHAALPTMALAEEARRHVTVVLTGDGGDEVFGGYEHYRVMLLRDALRAVGRRVPESLANVLRDLPGATGRRAGRLLPKAGAAPHAVDDVGVRGFRGRLFDLASPALRARLTEHDPDAAHRRAFEAAGHLSSADRAMETDLVTQLPDDFLFKIDAATMAHGVEARCPMLDVDLFALMRRVSATQKLAGHRTKDILRRLARAKLPMGYAERAKRGFSPDLGRILRTEDGHRFAASALTHASTMSHEYLDLEALRGLLDDHVRGRADHGQRLFAWMMIDFHHRIFVDRTLDGSPDRQNADPN